jgi:hypothetical protein
MIDIRQAHKSDHKKGGAKGETKGVSSFLSITYDFDYCKSKVATTTRQV